MNFDQYNGNGMAMHGNILPLPDLQANNFMNSVG
jgi:hypothetical protein